MTLTAFPTAKLYLPAGGVSTWRKKGFLPTDETKYASYGEGSKQVDPFEATTGGEIKSVDFGKAHINQVRARARDWRSLFTTG